MNYIPGGRLRILFLNNLIHIPLDSSYKFLALGDSYTIGEQVRIFESFPYQTISILRAYGLAFTAPEIVAVTGWTSGELITGMENTKLLDRYDYASLLIGVNNQYRGLPIKSFQLELETLVEKALKLLGQKAAHLYMLSIPDWGCSEFARGRDQPLISREIDEYNSACKIVASKYSIEFLDITADQRSDGNKEDFYAGDKLHPSGKEYTKWAEKLAKEIKSTFTRT